MGCRRRPPRSAAATFARSFRVADGCGGVPTFRRWLTERGLSITSDTSWSVSHLRRFRTSTGLLTQRLRAGLTCDAPPALKQGAAPPALKQGAARSALREKL